MSERKEILKMLRVLWRKGDSSLRRMYPSWEDLEANLDFTVEEKTKKEYMHKACPYCKLMQKIEKPIDDLFPYVNCMSCKKPFHVDSNLNVRKLTEEEEENMPAEWVRVLEDLNKKKMAIVFKLE